MGDQAPVRTRYNCQPGRHGCLCHASHWLGGLRSVPFWRRVPEEAPLEGLAGWTLITGREQGGGDHRAGPEQCLRSRGAGSDATPGPGVPSSAGPVWGLSGIRQPHGGHQETRGTDRLPGECGFGQRGPNRADLQGSFTSSSCLGAEDKRLMAS